MGRREQGRRGIPFEDGDGEDLLKRKVASPRIGGAHTDGQSGGESLREDRVGEELPGGDGEGGVVGVTRTRHQGVGVGVGGVRVGGAEITDERTGGHELRHGGRTETDRRRGIVDGRDRHGDRGVIAVHGSVGDAVGEAVGAEIIGRGGVEHGVGQDVQRAVGRGGDDRNGQRVAVNIGAQVRPGGGHILVHGQSGVLAGGSVVDRRHRQGDYGGGAVGLSVFDLVREAVFTGEIGIGQIGEGAVRIEVQIAVGGVGDLERREHIPSVGIGVIEEHALGGGYRQEGVLGGAVGVHHSGGGLVGGADGDGYRGRIRAAVAVRNGVSEGIRAKDVGRRSVDAGAGAGHGSAQGRERIVGADGQRIAVHIRVIAQHVDIHRAVFKHRGGVVLRIGRIVDGQDIERDRGDVGIQPAVVGFEGEGITAVVVQVGGVGEQRRLAAELAVGGRSDRRVGQRRAFLVRGGQGDLDRSIFIDLNTLTLSHWGIVDRMDGDGDSGGIGKGGAVRSAISERIRSGIVGAWLIGEAAVGSQREGSVADVGHQLRGERVAVCIRVVAQNPWGRNGQEQILIHGVAVIHGDGGGVALGDGDGDGSGRGVQLAVVDFEGEGIFAVVIQARGIGEVGRRAAECAVGRRGDHRVGQP